MEKKRKTDEETTNLEDYSVSPNFHETITMVPVESLQTSGNKIFICSREDKLVEVWKGLSKHNFHSVPVLSKVKNKYYGIVDLHDITRFVLSFFGKEELKDMGNFWKIVEKSEKLKNVTVNSVMSFPRSVNNPFHPVTVGYSLHFALEVLAREDHLERVPIITRDRSLYNMLTISRVVQFFFDNKKILGKRLNKPISMIGSSTKGVFSIKTTDHAYEAFNLMNEKHVSAVAVINEKEQLVGVISQTDLKVISEDGSLFYKLHQDAKTFVETINKKGVVFATKNDTFEKVLNLLQENKIHRLFVVNDDIKPVGIMSMKDLVCDVMTR